MSKTLLLFMLINISFYPIISSCSNNSNPTNGKNNPPVITKIIANPSTPTTSERTNLSCIATDSDGDSLSYTWESKHGVFSNNIGSTVNWNAPSTPGNYSCAVIVSDGIELVSDSITFTLNYPNRRPVEPYNPTPSDGATNVNISPTLSWECTDPDGDPITFDIRFGKSNYVQTVKLNHTENSYNPGTLEAGVFYSWDIIAKDNNGHEIRSDLWSFRVSE